MKRSFIVMVAVLAAGMACAQEPGAADPAAETTPPVVTARLLAAVTSTRRAEPAKRIPWHVLSDSMS